MKKKPVQKKSSRKTIITKKKSSTKKPPRKKTPTKKRSGKMETDPLSPTTPKPPILVPIPSVGYLEREPEIPENGKWMEMRGKRLHEWKIPIKIKNEGGDMDMEKDMHIKVKLRFLDGLYHGEGNDKTDEPQEINKIDALAHNGETPTLEFDMPSEGEYLFDPDFPIEIIIDEGKEWQSSTRLYLEDPRKWKY